MELKSKFICIWQPKGLLIYYVAMILKPCLFPETRYKAFSCGNSGVTSKLLEDSNFCLLSKHL